jgi:hypothetical protein
MLTRFMLSLLLLLFCGMRATAQSSNRTSPQPSSVAVSPQATPQVTKVNGRPGLDKESYRVIVDSVQKQANNYRVTLIFENLTDKSIAVKWLYHSMFDRRREKDPYLIDEKNNKYPMQAKDWDGILANQFAGGEEILPYTNVKLTYLFYGPGNGTMFDLVAIDLNDGQPVVIKGVKVTSNEDANASSALPTFVTESYRVVVESMKRDADNLTMTLIFESLADQPFGISWGNGSYEGGIWASSEPYLIDENADRYYLRGQDTAQIIGNNNWGRYQELLPGTKLKTKLVFRVTGNGTIFTFGCKENGPVGHRPIVIRGLKVE